MTDGRQYQTNRTESEPNGDDAREDIWMVERGMIPRWASQYTATRTPKQSALSAWVQSENRAEVGERVAERTAQRQEVVQADDALTAAYFAGLEQGRRERGGEQIGDALAASQGKAREHFETLLGDLGFEDALKYGCSGGPDQDSMRESVEIIRHHLTASGVPEGMWRLPGNMKEHADRLNDANDPSASGHVRKWAEKVEAALASAPAVHPDYPRVTMDELRKVYGIVIRYIDRLNDPISESEFNLDAAQMCDELEDAIAAAPQRGDNDE